MSGSASARSSMDSVRSGGELERLKRSPAASVIANTTKSEYKPMNSTVKKALIIGAAILAVAGAITAAYFLSADVRSVLTVANLITAAPYAAGGVVGLGAIALATKAVQDARKERAEKEKEEEASEV